MKYNIIGDIHCRTIWKDLVRENCINVFVGDYFSPYENISFAAQKKNFLDIIEYKKKHPATILLIGNHDEDHWHIHERYSRFDFKHAMEIEKLFEDNKQHFQIACATDDNNVLITHAGVSVVWFANYMHGYNNHSYINAEDINTKSIEDVHDIIVSEMRERIENYDDIKDGSVILWRHKFYIYVNKNFRIISINPKQLSVFLNELWASGNYDAFNFRNNSDMYDSFGDSQKQGPLWIRPDTLQETNIFKYANKAQVVGHTQFPLPSTYIFGACRNFTQSSLMDNEEDKIYFVDCLGYNNVSLIYDDKIFTINKKN